MKKTICILGEGAWGTAVATLLAHNGFTVRLWCYDATVAQTIKTKRINEQFLPGVRLSEQIQPVTDLKEATCDVHWIFEAIPIKYLRSVLQQAQPCFTQAQVWVVLSKGIEQDSLLLPTQMIDDVFKQPVKKAVFAGPSFAHEVARKEITAVCVAATDCTLARELQAMLANEYFRPYFTTDIIGIQVGAAIKNVITLGVGILDGAGYGDNSKSFFITRGLQEMGQISALLGGQKETMYGLAGIGDLVLTSLGKLSRNLEVGKRLGRGEKLQTIIQETGYTPEGINTVIAINQLMQKHKKTFPLCYGIHAVIQGKQKVEKLFEELLREPLFDECNLS